MILSMDFKNFIVYKRQSYQRAQWVGSHPVDSCLPSCQSCPAWEGYSWLWTSPGRQAVQLDRNKKYILCTRSQWNHKGIIKPEFLRFYLVPCSHLFIGATSNISVLCLYYISFYAFIEVILFLSSIAKRKVLELLTVKYIRFFKTENKSNTLILGIHPIYP